MRLFCLFSCDLSSEKVMFCFCPLSSSGSSRSQSFEVGIAGRSQCWIVWDDSSGRAGLRSCVQCSEQPEPKDADTRPVSV